MRPVFLFNVGIVVFVISPATGEVHRFFAVYKMALEMIIEKLAAIVGIKAE